MYMASTLGGGRGERQSDVAIMVGAVGLEADRKGQLRGRHETRKTVSTHI